MHIVAVRQHRNIKSTMWRFGAGWAENRVIQGRNCGYVAPGAPLRGMGNLQKAATAISNTITKANDARKLVYTNFAVQHVDSPAIIRPGRGHSIRNSGRKKARIQNLAA
jgi:hypothetical protein